MKIDAARVKTLRDQTGLGMMDCKQALEETGGDIEAAITYLRKKGLAAAGKRAAKAATEGLVVTHVAEDGRRAAILELNCETDFVARTDDFLALAEALVRRVTAGEPPPADDDGAALTALPLEEGPAGDRITAVASKLGENIKPGRFRSLRREGAGAIIPYVHTGSKLGVLVELACEKAETAGTPDFLEVGKNVALHTAASAPRFLQESEVSEADLAREREIFKEQAMKEGKPEPIAEKIVAGRMKLSRLTVCAIDNRSATHGWPGGIAERFRLEGWSSATVDGRDHDAIEAALSMSHPESPHVVVAEVERKR